MMKIIQSVLVAAVIAAFSSGANCDPIRFEFDGVVTYVTSQSDLPKRINIGDVISGFVDMEPNLAPKNRGRYDISPATQDWIDAEVSIGGVKYSTEGFIGTSGYVGVQDDAIFYNFVDDRYTILSSFENPTSASSFLSETISLYVDLLARRMPSLPNFITGEGLEQNFTWNREPDNNDPPTGTFSYQDEGVQAARLYVQFSLQRVKVGQATPTSPVALSGTIKARDGTDICAMVLASGQFMFSCNPNGVMSLSDLPREPDGTVKRQIYADGYFPKIHTLPSSIDIPVILTRSGDCPNYNTSYDPGFVPGSAGKRINIVGKVLTQNSQTPICAMVLANGQHTFSCGGSGSYALNIPLDSNGQFKLQVYADGYAPTIQALDEFKTTNNVRMAYAAECTGTSSLDALPASFLDYFDGYYATAEKKAIALALDPDGRWTGGYSYNRSSQDQANDTALSRCRGRLSEYQVNTDCRIYAIGEYVVW